MFDDWYSLQDDFLIYLEMELNRSPATITAYRKATTYFFNYLKQLDITDPSEVTSETIKDYIRYLVTERNYKPRSRAQALAALKSFFSYLELEGVVPRNPVVRIKSPKLGQPLPRYLTQEEVELMIETADDGTPRGKRNAALITCLFYTAGRLSEIVNLKLTDFDDDMESVMIHGKGDKFALLPVHPVLKETLTDYIKSYRKDNGSPYLFPGDKGVKIGKSTVGKIVANTAKQAGIEKQVSPHVLRHSLATCLAELDGVELIDIQHFLRHTKLSTTKIYLHTNLKHLKEAVEKLPAL